MIYVAIQGDCNIRKKEHTNLEKQWNTEKGKIEFVKSQSISGASGTPSALTPKLVEWLQLIPETPLEIFAQISAVLETVKILFWALNFLGLW